MADYGNGGSVDPRLPFIACVKVRFGLVKSSLSFQTCEPSNVQEKKDGSMFSSQKETPYYLWIDVNGVSFISFTEKVRYSARA